MQEVSRGVSRRVSGSRSGAGSPRRAGPLAWVALLLCLTLAVAGCGSSDDDGGGSSTGGESTPASGGGGEAAAVKLGTVRSITNLPVVVAQAKGYFEDEGIDLEIQYFNSGVDIVPALASSQLDIGEGSVTPGVFNSFARDVRTPLVAYKAGCAPRLDFCPLVVRQELADDFRSWADIKGKKVAISQRWTASDQKLKILDEQNGLVEGEDYELVELPFTDMGQALASGAVDAAIVIEPIATGLEQRGIGKRMLTPELEADVPVIFTAYSEDFASDDGPDSPGVRYQRAFIRGVADVLAARDAFDSGDKEPWHALTELPLVSETHPELANPDTRDAVSVASFRAEPLIGQADFDSVREFYVRGDQLRGGGEDVTYDDIVAPQFVEQALGR